MDKSMIYELLFEFFVLCFLFCLAISISVVFKFFDKVGQKLKKIFPPKKS